MHLHRVLNRPNPRRRPETNMPIRYRKRPVVVEAMQLVGNNAQLHAVYQWWTADHPASVVVSDDEFSYDDDEYLRDMFLDALGDVWQDTEVVVRHFYGGESFQDISLEVGNQKSWAANLWGRRIRPMPQKFHAADTNAVCQ